jgi:hypothetical protein
LYIIPSSEENLLTAPPNLTTMFNPGLFWHEPTFYMGPHPIEGLGTIVPFTPYALGSYTHPWGLRAGAVSKGMGQVDPTGITSVVSGGLSIAQQIGNFLVPSVTGMQAQDATTLVNGLEPYLKMNLATFMRNPTPANQQGAINAFNQIWEQIVQGCSQLAGPGTKCVNDRAPGGKVDWWKLYYDPVANYVFPSGSSVVSGGTSSSNTASVASTAGQVMSSPLLLLGIAAIVGFIVMNQKGGN